MGLAPTGDEALHKEQALVNKIERERDDLRVQLLNALRAAGQKQKGMVFISVT